MTASQVSHPRILNSNINSLGTTAEEFNLDHNSAKFGQALCVVKALI